MRTTAFVLSAFAALAAAAPRAAPQDLDYDAIDAMATPTATGPPVGVASDSVPVNTQSMAALASASILADPTYRIKRDVEKRGVNDPCSPQPSSASPPSGANDTPPDFLAEPNFASTASNAPVPAGYTNVFTNLQGSTGQDGYLGYKLLKNYDPYQCQQYCDQTTGCVAFNLYLERDPSLAPADACTNPAADTNVKCSIWGLPISAASAGNQGQYRSQFQVVITASNGYTKDPNPPACANYNGPTPLGGAINAPLLNGVNTYMRSVIYNGAFNPCQCTAACDAQTAYNSRHGGKSCTFTNAYVLSKNGVAQGTYCALYTNSWDPSYATNEGQTRGSDYYTVSDSYSYSTS
ncbi:MAG: hypothetical protein M1824_002506 [Vezdaea acicularis]|nr:MAG: hypothetical protein M1824_002506 [Vezdaea acicularis]